MLAIALGLGWLVLGPLSLWVVLRGRNPAKVGAVLTLALLEVGTVWLNDHHSPPPAAATTVDSHDVPPAPACQEGTPVPSHARLAGHHDSLTLSWTARAQECATAKVVVRHKGVKLRVWIHEGPLSGHHEGVQTVPVRVEGATASLRLPLDLPPRPRYITIDGRTGDRIPQHP